MTEWAVSLSSRKALARARKRGWKTYSKGGKRYSTSASKKAQKASKGFKPIRRGGGAMIIASLLKGLSRYVKRSTMAERGVGRWSGRRSRTSIKDQRPIVVGSGTGRAVNKPKISSGGGSKKGQGRAWSITKGTVIGGLVGTGLGTAFGLSKDESPRSKRKSSPGPSLKQKKAPSMASTTPAGFTSKGGKWVKKGQSFGQAFSEARKKGEGTKFSWQGKSYVAVSKEDLKKRGLKDLGEWQKRKKSIKALKKKGLMMRKVSTYT